MLWSVALFFTPPFVTWQLRLYLSGHRQLVGSGYSDAGDWQWALGFIANPYYRFRPRLEIFGSSKLYALQQ
jgi:hypothetical protein